MYRLFRNYPPEKLVVVGPEASPGAKRLDCSYLTVAPFLQRLERTRFSKVPRILDLAGPLRLNLRDIRSRLPFKPQAVVTVMQSMAYYRAAAHLAREWNLPLILLVHDVPEQFEPIYEWARRRQRKMHEQIYRQATRRLCISPEMRDHFALKFRISGDVLYPPPSTVGARDIADSRELRDPSCLTIGYAGSVGYGYGQQLVSLLPAFKKSGTRLRVYSNNSLPVSNEIVTNCGGGEPEAVWARVKAECDAVILPYLFEGEHALYSTHFPSKLPEYLRLGLPVLAVGPPYATGVRFAQRHSESILAIAENNLAAVEQALRRLRDEPQLRLDLAANAGKLALRFDPEIIAGQFHNILIDAVRTTTSAQSRTREQ